jgi:hypothetical protein
MLAENPLLRNLPEGHPVAANYPSTPVRELVQAIGEPAHELKVALVRADEDIVECIIVRREIGVTAFGVRLGLNPSFELCTLVATTAEVKSAKCRTDIVLPGCEFEPHPLEGEINAAVDIADVDIVSEGREGFSEDFVQHHFSQQ